MVSKVGSFLFSPCFDGYLEIRKGLSTTENQQSLYERIKHIAFGFFKLIPVVNRLTLFVEHKFFENKKIEVINRPLPKTFQESEPQHHRQPSKPTEPIVSSIVEPAIPAAPLKTAQTKLPISQNCSLLYKITMVFCGAAVFMGAAMWLRKPSDVLLSANVTIALSEASANTSLSPLNLQIELPNEIKVESAQNIPSTQEAIQNEGLKTFTQPNLAMTFAVSVAATFIAVGINFLHRQIKKILNNPIPLQGPVTPPTHLRQKSINVDVKQLVTPPKIEERGSLSVTAYEKEDDKTEKNIRQKAEEDRHAQEKISSSKAENLLHGEDLSNWSNDLS